MTTSAKYVGLLNAIKSTGTSSILLYMCGHSRLIQRLNHSQKFGFTLIIHNTTFAQIKRKRVTNLINVGFDGQIYFAQVHGGIKNYFTNLIETFLLDKSYGINPVFYFVNRNKSHVPETFKINKELEFRGMGNIFDVVTPKLTKKPISLIHQTYYFPHLNKLFPYVPHVTTIHDMIPEILSQKRFSYNPHFAKHSYFNSSDGVICVSDTTLRDLKNIY